MDVELKYNRTVCVKGQIDARGTLQEVDPYPVLVFEKLFQLWKNPLPFWGMIGIYALAVESERSDKGFWMNPLADYHCAKYEKLTSFMLTNRLINAITPILSINGEDGENYVTCIYKSIILPINRYRKP